MQQPQTHPLPEAERTHTSNSLHLLQEPEPPPILELVLILAKKNNKSFLPSFAGRGKKCETRLSSHLQHTQSWLEGADWQLLCLATDLLHHG